MNTISPRQQQSKQDRIARGALLFTAGNVKQIAADQWKVRSATDEATTYNVTPTSCDCRDAKKAQTICKHQWSSAGHVAAVIIVAIRRAETIEQINQMLAPV